MGNVLQLDPSKKTPENVYVGKISEKFPFFGFFQ